MGKVFIDGELVEFDGPAPASGGEVCQLVDGFLSGQGKVVASVLLDGEAVSFEQASERRAYETLDFKTTTPERQLLDMCRVWGGACERHVEELARLGRESLRKRWDQSQSEVVDFLDAFRPVVEGLGILQSYGAEARAAWLEGFGPAFEKGVGAIDLVVDAIEARSPARLSDALAGPMHRTWSTVQVELREGVIPALEGGTPR